MKTLNTLTSLGSELADEQLDEVDGGLMSYSPYHFYSTYAVVPDTTIIVPVG